MKILSIIIFTIQLLVASNANNEDKIEKLYYKDTKTLKSITKIKNKKKLYTKLYYKNGNLKAEVFFANKRQKEDIFKTYDLDGNLTETAYVRTDTKPNIMHKTKYKNGLKTQEHDEIKIGKKWVKDGIRKIYNNGNVWLYEYYTKGHLLYSSYCSYDTSKYLSKLIKKELNKVQDYEGGDVYCKRLNDSSYDILIKLLFDNKKNISLLIGAFDTRTKKLKFSKVDDYTGLGYPKNISIDNITYKAKTDPRVFDVVNTEECYRGEEVCPNTYATYKVAIKKIVQLAHAPFKLRNIIQDVKDGKSLSDDLLSSILMEEEVNIDNINLYMELLNWFKQNKEHKKIVILSRHILDRYPNKIELNLILADSSLALGLKNVARYNYKIYLNEMQFLERGNEVPRRVLDFLSNNKSLKFTDYEIQTTYTTPNKPLIQKGFGRLYRTRLKKALKEKKPEFAAKQIIAQWGCDEGKNECTTGGIIDASTGKATEFPFKYYAHNGSKEIIYRLNSSLIIFAGDFEFKDGRTEENRVLFYEFRDGEFLFLKALEYKK